MSEMAVDEARDLCTMPWHDGDGYDFDEAVDGFDRMIAEVERAAAEKAWDACDDAITAALFARGNCRQRCSNAWPTNPYRAALGLTAGQERDNDEG